MKTFYVESDILEILKNIKDEIKLINNKKILLLGSNGFLGKYFVKIFDQIITEKKAKFSVDCFDNYISSSSSNKTKIKNKDKIKFYKADVSTHTFKKKYDIIIFLAGIASPFIYKKNPLKTLSVSYGGVSNLIAKAKKEKSKFVFLAQVKYMEIQIRKIYQPRKRIMAMLIHLVQDLVTMKVKELVKLYAIYIMPTITQTLK